MRKHLAVLLAVFITTGLVASGAEQASARLFCLSLQFQSVTQDFNLQSLSFTRGSQNNPPNGELRPLFNSAAPSHGSGFILRDPNFGIVQGEIAFDVPAVPDTTGDGFSDFFKTSRAVPNTVTAGVYESYDGIFSGKVSAVWNRAAGSATGTCAVTMTDDTFDTLGTFNMPFALLEYQGVLSYTGRATNVDANVALGQLPDQANSLSGAVELWRPATNSANQILLQPGVWTNNQGQSLVYTNALIQRDLGILTNYYGFLSFFDGNPATPDPDYFYWELSINDGNDANGNGIPDLTDGATPVPAAPQLSFGPVGGGGVTLMVAATPGRQVTIQSSPGLPATAAGWMNAVTVMVTNSPQAVSVGAPVANQFWRAVVFY